MVLLFGGDIHDALVGGSCAASAGAGDDDVVVQVEDSQHHFCIDCRQRQCKIVCFPLLLLNIRNTFGVLEI